jgi:hypothetical protein
LTGSILIEGHFSDAVHPAGCAIREPFDVLAQVRGGHAAPLMTDL